MARKITMFQAIKEKTNSAITTKRQASVHLIKLILPLSVMMLSGCTSMFSDDARCPFGDQGGCQSVEDVNKMIDQRKFTADGHFVQQAQDNQDKMTDTSTSAHAQNWSGWNALTPYSGDPLRTQEIDARMWVSPWQDEDNNYHGSSYITFVVQSSQWANQPVKAISSEDYEDA